MRVLVDLVDAIGTSIRFIFLLIFLAIFAFGFLLTAGVSYVAPKVVEDVGERADRYVDRYDRRLQSYELGKEGWGHSSSPGAARASTRGEFGEDNGGWVDERPNRRR